ncbi:DUF1128 domain-containing protein [Siminovitchia sp. FSL H7-0308]|uniref:UPF0435 protein JOC94_004087 n=1 Tax=Siminovitchia thermophila TaxID=1245522 RepID=A0ABS2RBM6_9BACI|nr:DUF1128 domain-containing protein [Siminovitchia thermophila]MBM7717063.1 uncharacterized protein YfkK (UPF0435 family) [Siminovitchia thermophila]ONK25141.1 hypothetical protein BLX87_01460 [Bacillus sp. VT-16-64]
MDLSKNKPQNIEYMLNQITEKLRMVNTSAVKAEAINEELYEELCEIYEMVMKKEHFTPNEMEAIAEELGRLRK